MVDLNVGTVECLGATCPEADITDKDIDACNKAGAGCIRIVAGETPVMIEEETENA